MNTAALNSTAGGGDPRFVNTQWSLVLAAAGEGGGQPAPEKNGFAQLYGNYCFPVYVFIRRRGHSRQDAQDLTQDFFVHLVKRETLRRADPHKGRFRTFLLGALEYFLADAARREGAAKRGGGARLVFLDDPEAAEHAYQLAAPAGQTPECLFEARWAAALIAAAFGRLREEMATTGKAPLFDALRDYVAGAEDASYQRKAEELGLSLSALKSAIHRLRGRYGVLLREEVARTVAGPGEVEAEVRHLRAALRAG